LEDQDFIAKLRVDAKADVAQAIASVKKLYDGVGDVTGEFEKLNKAGEQVQTTMREAAGDMDEVGKASRQTTQDVAAQTSGFKALTDQLDELKQARKLANKENVVKKAADGTLKPGDGTGMDATRKMSNADIAAQLAVADAGSQNEISNMRKVQAERVAQHKLGQSMADDTTKRNEKLYQDELSAADSAFKKKEVARAREDQIINDFISGQTKMRDDASKQNIAFDKKASDKQQKLGQSMADDTTRRNEAAFQSDLKLADKEFATKQKLADDTSKAYHDNTKRDADLNEKAGQARLKQNAAEYKSSKKRSDDISKAYAENARRDTATLEKAGQARLKQNADELRARQKQSESLISARYALYDVATTAGVASAAMLGSALIAVKASSDFEKAFTAVERTSQGSVEQIEGLRDALVDLSTQVPLTFEELSAIAALGNQLGVAAGDIEDFTGTVSRFSAVTGITAEATANAFGRISNLLGLPIEDAERLGSSIVKVGVSSETTEQQILALTERLAATATRAGFTADQVIGLSGALGSLGVAPERAQGVFETYFNSLNESLSEGGDKLAAFTAITGQSAESLNEMVRSGQGFEVFKDFLGGLDGADTVQMTGALKELGLEGKRTGEVIGRISAGLPVLKRGFDDAATGYAEGAELARQYALIADDLDSQFKMLVNSLNALIAELTGGSVDGIAGLLSVLTDVVNKARELSENKVVQGFAKFALVFTVIAGAALGLVAMLALATASTFALRTAQLELGKMGQAGGIRGLIKAMFHMKTGTDVATVGTHRLTAAVKGLMRATVILAAIGAVTELVFNFGGSMQFVADTAHNVIDGLERANDAIFGFLSTMAEGNDVLSFFVSRLAALQGESGILDAADGFSSWAYKLKNANDVTSDYSDEALKATGLTDDWGNEFEDLSDSVEDATAKVVTLIDYAGDLGGVMGRAFDIRYAGGQGLDAISSGWISIADAADASAKSISDAQQAIRDYRATANELSADRGVLEYFKRVADKYNDTLHSADLAAKLEKNQNDLSDANKGASESQAEINKLQAASTMSLTGNSAASIANRSTILGLVSNYQGYISALAASGASQADLSAKSNVLKQDFQNQATQAGFSSTEIDLYSKAFDDMTFAIDNVPRDITVDADNDPAMQALNEFLAAAAAAAAAGVDIPLNSTGAGAAGRDAANEYSKGWDAMIDSLSAPASQYGPLKSGYVLNPIGYSGGGGGGGGGGGVGPGKKDGGYTGDGGVNEPADYVHGKEFVFSAPATKNIGVDQLAGLHDVAKRGKGFKGGGYVGRGGSTGGGFGGPTDLSAGTIMALAEAVSRINVNLFTDDRRLAESTNRGQMQLASGGTN